MIDLQKIGLQANFNQKYYDFYNSDKINDFVDYSKYFIRFIFDQELFENHFYGLKKRYSQYNFIPFARGSADDIVVCFSVNDNLEKVYIIQDFQGYENPVINEFKNFIDFIDFIKSSNEFTRN